MRHIKVTDQHCQILACIEHEAKCNATISNDLDFSVKTTQERVHRMEALGLVTKFYEVNTDGKNPRRSRFNAITPYGREILEKYKRGHKFPKMSTHGPAAMVNRDVKKAPEYTWGRVFEDAKVPRMTPIKVAHAQTMPWRGKDSLAE